MNERTFYSTMEIDGNEITSERSWSSDQVRRACIRNNLYTLGTNEEYSNMLDNYTQLEDLHNRVTHELRVVLGIATKLTIVDCKTLERFQGKAKRILDLRNQES